MRHDNDMNYRTADLTFMDLCRQVDYWKEQAEYFEQKYKDEVRENNKQMNERLEESRMQLGNALMFAFSVEDKEDGSLSISADKRKILSERLKEQS